MTDRLDERLRRLLRGSEPHVDPQSLLADVHAGARLRRRRRGAALVAASVVAVAGLSTPLALQLVGRDSGVAGGPSPAPATSGPPASSPATPAPESPAATTRPDAGLPRDAALGTTGIDGTPAGETWRVSAEDCDGTVCARLSRSEGDGWSTLRVFTWDDAALGRRSADAPPVDAPVDAPVDSVRVAQDGQDAWVFGRQLWSTHDGGSSWERQLLDPDRPPEAVQVAPQTDRVFALQPRPLRLWESEVSGDSWTPVVLPRGHTVAEALVAVEGTVGIVTYSPSTDRRVMLTSHDGGATWQQSELPCVGEFGPVQATARTMFLHCSTGSGPGMDVWRSGDGDTWEVMATVTVPTYVDDAVPVDDRTVLVVTGDGGLLVTARDEQPVPLRLGDDETVLFGRFLDPERGYLVLAPRRLLVTDDGGRHWSEVPES